MGSEGKTRKRTSPPISEDEGRGKKHRTKEDRDRRSKRKKDKEKSKKSRKHSRDDSDRGSKSVEKPEKRDREHKKRSRHHDVKELSDDDYFSKNNEFSTWLKEEKGVFFSDLSSEDARKLFSRFVKDWNSQKLHSRYYEGIASAPRTAHAWKIKEK